MIHRIRVWVTRADRRLVALALIIGLFVIGFLDYTDSTDQFAVLGFLRYFFRSIAGHLLVALLTLLAADWIAFYRVIESEKRALILALGSPDNSIALEAARVLRVRGWLEDGTLREVFLSKANLQHGQLWQADLQSAELIEANLQNGDLHGITFVNAKLWQLEMQHTQLMDATFEAADVRQSHFDQSNLWRANLSRIRMEHSSLAQCDLRQADLRGAFLMRVDLGGANLADAKLVGTRFLNVSFNEETILPDGTRWASGADLTRFTHLPLGSKQGIRSHDTMKDDD